MSISFNRHTAHKAKLLSIAARAYAVGDALVFDTSPSETVIDDGIHLNPALDTLTLPPPGTYRIDIYSGITTDTLGKKFSLFKDTGSGPTPLVSSIPFGQLFSESFFFPRGTTIQLRSDDNVTIGTGADQVLWFEVSM